MNAIKQADLTFGLNYEKKFQPIIEELFCMKFKKMGYYSQMDFINRENKILVEVKNRRIRHNSFNEIMIGKNKIEKARKMKNDGFRTFIFWNFKDGLYFYEPKEKDEGGMYLADGGTSRRGENEIKLCYYIPHSLLTKAEKLTL